MASDWNGLSLQTEFATMLGDTTTAFLSKVSTWINDIQFDICARHDWPFLRKKGKIVLTASAEIQTLNISAPTAPTAALSVGGALVEASSYYVLITYYEGTTGAESIGGASSLVMTPTALNKTIDLTAIPVSGNPLVTARNVYLKKDTGVFYYYGQIANNTATTYSIAADTTSTATPPDYSYIRKLDGNPFFEGTTQGYVRNESIDQIRLMFPGTFPSGTPELWADMGAEYITMYPIPSSALTLSFYYFKHPKKIYADSTAITDLPPWMKMVLKAGVLTAGYEYRERDGFVSKRNEYEDILNKYISKNGRPVKGSGQVRDVTGNCDGYTMA